MVRRLPTGSDNRELGREPLYPLSIAQSPDAHGHAGGDAP